MLEDLCTDIYQCHELGDQIVLMINLNQNITSDTVTYIFANVGLTEAINHRHLDTFLVTTYQRLSHLINGIYTSRTLQVLSLCYIPFGNIPSDHHLLWIKIELYSSFGAKMDTLVPHNARRLKIQKPDTINNLYNYTRNSLVAMAYIWISSTYRKGWFLNPSQPSYKTNDRLLLKIRDGILQA